MLVAGGGVGGLEGALALRTLAPSSTRVRMLAPDRAFTYRPLSVGEPFGGPRTVQVPLADIASDRGFELVRDALDHVEPDRRAVVTQEGATLDYDVLVMALGARPLEAVPGAVTFRGPRDVARVRGALQQLTRLDRPRMVFAAAGGTSWTLPLYELALLSSRWAAEAGLDAQIALVTAEEAPLEAFGPLGSAKVAALLEDRGVALRVGTVALAAESGGLLLAGEAAPMPADLVVALPYLAGPAVRGLPYDDAGFVPVDDLGRVRDVEDVYAVGDMTDRPLKQGGLAAQHADVAARAIAAAAGEPVRAEPLRPVLRGLLLTGGEPVYLRNPPAGEHEGPADAAGSPEAWWPPHKVFGEHLAPYLATHAELLVPAGVA